MASRVRFASRLLLLTIFFLAAYYLPQYVFGTVSLLHHDNSEPNLELCPGRQLLGLRLEYGKKLNVAITRMTPRTEYEVRLSYPASYPAECTVDVRLGATSLDDSIGGSGRELLNTEKNMFNSGKETEGIAEISCDTIAVVSLSSSTPPPNHVVFNLALADMAGPIPKDSYALIVFAAVCVVATVFAALYYLPIVALFFADVSVETKD